MIELRKPSAFELADYVAALERGWSPNTVRTEEVIAEQLAAIKEDVGAFLASLWDTEARGAPIAQPDGTFSKRLPGVHFWIWDGAFCGSIGFRWVKGTSELPPHVLGHIGYSVVPWKRGQGCATKALARLLPYVREQGLTYVDLTTDPDNIASQKVITNNGGALMEEFTKPASYGGGRALRFRLSVDVSTV